MDIFGEAANTSQHSLHSA